MAAILIVGAGAANVLDLFGSVDGTADVDQSVVMEDESSFDYTAEMFSGETHSELVDIENRANVPVDITHDSTVTDSEDNDVTSGAEVRYGVSNGHELISTDGLTGEKVDDYDTQVDYMSEFHYDYDADTVEFHVLGDFEDVSEEDEEAVGFGGIRFDVEGETEENPEISVSTREGDSHEGNNVDWVLIKVDGEWYADYTVETETQNFDEYDWLDSNLDSATPEGDIEAVQFASGTATDSGSQTASDIYYSDFQFNGESLLNIYDDEADITMDRESSVDNSVILGLGNNLEEDEYTVDVGVAPANPEVVQE